MMCAVRSARTGQNTKLPGWICFQFNTASVTKRYYFGNHPMRGPLAACGATLSPAQREANAAHSSQHPITASGSRPMSRD